MTRPLTRRAFAQLTAAAFGVPFATGPQSIFDGKTLDGWVLAEKNENSPPGWIVKDGVMASTGSGRGVIYTAKDYGRFRFAFTMRHVSGSPDHQACVLIFCTRPQAGEKPLDALGGIQFQVPNG